MTLDIIIQVEVNAEDFGINSDDIPYTAAVLHSEVLSHLESLDGVTVKRINVQETQA